MSAEPSVIYADLAHLPGAYLNQDYDIYGPALKDAVLTFCRDDGPGAVAAVRRDIGRVLLEDVNDVDSMLDKIDSGRAQPPEMSGRDYLLWLDSVLAEPGATRPVRDHAAE